MNEKNPAGMQNQEAPYHAAQQRRSRVERTRQEVEKQQKPWVNTEGAAGMPQYAASAMRRKPASSFRPDFTAGPSFGAQPGPCVSGVPLPDQPPVRTSHPTSKQHAEYATPQKAIPVAAAKKAGRSLLINRLLLLVCAAVFAVSSFLLIRYFANIFITRRASAQLEEAYQTAIGTAATEEPPAETPTPTPLPTATQPPVQAQSAVRPTAVPSVRDLWPNKYPGNPTLRISSVFYELQRQNPDIIGWLKIDGVLEEAVVQRDNEYYLTHNALKQKSVTGALFLDENCDLKTVPTQMLIHGHNMKEGAMFGALKKYKVKDASFYRAHPYIDFNTIYENGTYVIFAVAEVDLRWNKGDYLPFWEDVRFGSVQSFMDYVHKMRDLSHYRCNVDVQPGDRLLTLSTCTGNDDNKRLVVMARRLRDNENKLELNMSIMSTADR